MEKERKTRWYKVVKLDYTDISEDKADRKINDAIATINEYGGNVISFSKRILGAGFSTVYLVFIIIYEAEEEITESYVKKAQKTNAVTMSKWVRFIKVSYSDIDKDKVEEIVNNAVRTITNKGGKITSFINEVFGVGLSAVWFINIIIYSSEKEI